MPFLIPQVGGLVRLQRLTGVRPGEACVLRLCDLERPKEGNVWLYRPASHKTAWRGKRRVVAVGPKAQAVLCEFIKIRCPLCGVEGRPCRIGSPDGVLCGPCSDRVQEENLPGPFAREEVTPPDAYLFSPADAVAEWQKDKRARRKTPVQPSQVCRKSADPKRLPRGRYDTTSYGRAVRRACEAAKVPHFHVNQLRHLFATEIRKRFGLEAAQVLLGHARADVTQVYAARDEAQACRVAGEVG